MAKTRFWRSTKGENAEVIVAKAIPYTTDATIDAFNTNAPEGEIGVFDADLNTLVGATSVLAAPTGVQVSTNTVGGAVPAQTSFYKIVAVNAAGVSLGSAEVSQASTGSTSSNQLSWNPAVGATSYRVYRGTVTNTQTGYQTTAGTSFLDQSATAGTAGTVPVAATGTVAAPLTDGAKYYVAIMRDGEVFKTTNIEYKAPRTRRTAYIAPVKQVTTINIPAAVVTANDTAIAAGTLKDFGLTLIETTPGNEPYPTLSYTYEIDNPAGVTTSSILTKIVADINNPLNLLHKDDGLQYSATVGSDGSSGYNVVVTSYYFGQHFRVALRGGLQNGTVTYTTPFKQGVGDSDSVSRIEDEGLIFAGVTTNYPGMALPEEFGKPTKFVVSGLTYTTYQMDPLRVSKEPMPQSVHHHYAHIYVIVPTPVGGDAPTRALSSPDYILGSILGFTLTP